MNLGQCLVFSMAALVVVVTAVQIALPSKTDRLITQCELELPRNQKCKIIAVTAGGVTS